jgi:hypothetical protein
MDYYEFILVQLIIFEFNLLPWYLLETGGTPALPELAAVCLLLPASPECTIFF